MGLSSRITKIRSLANCRRSAEAETWIKREALRKHFSSPLQKRHSDCNCECTSNTPNILEKFVTLHGVFHVQPSSDHAMLTAALNSIVKLKTS